MKWSDITKNLSTTDTSPEGVASRNRVKHYAAIALVALIVIVGSIILWRWWQARKANTPIIPIEELGAIHTFLDQNPPRPVTPSQAQMIHDTITAPVTLSESDQQALNDFINQ